jgi:hypothetical protein
MDETADFSYTFIEHLPPIAESVRFLDIRGTCLWDPPALHEGLEIFNCSDSSTTTILPPLPSTLKELYCEDTNITELP